MRCTQCIMPDTIPGINFDKVGVCNFCRDYKPFVPYGEEALRKIIDAKRQAVGKYDCIVPLSGGRDSTFVLYYVKMQLGLKPVAINFDNETRNPQALKNMQRACEIIGVDLEVVRSKRGIARKIIKANFRASIRLGLPNNLFTCHQCTYGYKSASYIKVEEYSSAEDTGDLTQALTRPQQRSRYWKLFNYNLYLKEYYMFLQRLELHVHGNSLLRRASPTLKNNTITEIKVFDYVKWDRRLIKDTIMTQLGWEKPAGHISSWRTDCHLHEIDNYIYVKLHGCSNGCLGYCNMIRMGQMTREEALAQEEHAIANCGENVEELIRDQVGLRKKEIAALLAM